MSETVGVHAPKDVLRLKFCTTCERDDRWAPLKPRHFWFGTICQGEVVDVVYRHPVVVNG